MKFQDSPPKTDGWYWFKPVATPSANEEEHKCLISRIRNITARPWLILQVSRGEVNFSGTVFTVYEMEGEWSERLEDPEE